VPVRTDVGTELNFTTVIIKQHRIYSRFSAYHPTEYTNRHLVGHDTCHCTLIRRIWLGCDWRRIWNGQNIYTGLDGSMDVADTTSPIHRSCTITDGAIGYSVEHQSTCTTTAKIICTRPQRIHMTSHDISQVTRSSSRCSCSMRATLCMITSMAYTIHLSGLRYISTE